MRVRSTSILALLVLSFCVPPLAFPLFAANDSAESDSAATEEINATTATVADAESNSTRARSTEDSFADMIDRALEREFPDNEQNEGSLRKTEMQKLAFCGFLGFRLGPDG